MVAPAAGHATGRDLTGRGPRVGRLESERWDLVVVGGGITGAAVLEEATRRGLRAALVERGDFAGGTSSASSKMLHGGLRYLAHGRVNLVRTAVRERDRLVPELGGAAVPTRLVVPFPRAFGARLTLRAGTWLYGAFSRSSAVGRRRRLTTSEVAQAAPGLDVRAIDGGAEVGEAVVDDAGLVLRRLVAAEAAGAVAVNRMTATALAPEGADRLALTLNDPCAGRDLTVRASRVANAAGVWSREWAGGRGAPAIRFSRGVHLVFPRSRWPVNVGVVLPTPDHRWVFVLPYGPFVLVGTTDVEESHAPTDVYVHPEDVRYLWDVLRRAYPSLPVGPADLIDAFAGVRALVGGPGRAVGDVARDELIVRGPGAAWTIVGGKLTTHRAMARRLCDTMGVPDRPGPSGLPYVPETMGMGGGVGPIPGGEWLYRWSAGDAEAPEAIVHRLVAAIRRTQPVSLGDLLDRRFHALHRLSPRFAEVAEYVADRAAELLGWSDDGRRAELGAYLSEVERTTRGVRAA